MYRTRSTFILFAIAVMILSSNSCLFAATMRTWVSGVGNDSNACSRTAPCATFAGALAKTTAGGVISVVDAGDYGPVTISQSVTIDGSGAGAGILASGTGITVTAGASDTVILKGVNIDGAGTGLTGVDFQTGGSLYVEKCTIANLTGNGITFAPTGASQLFITDTTIDSNVNPVPSPVPAGIYLSPAGSAVSTVSIDNIRIHGYAMGLYSKTHIKATVSNSVISGNSNQGIYAQGDSVVVAANCVLANNAKAGVQVNAANATVLINNDNIVNNVGGLVFGTSGGAVVSSGNNVVARNSGKGSTPTSTVARE
jgi:hypothetical protein